MSVLNSKYPWLLLAGVALWLCGSTLWHALADYRAIGAYPGTMWLASRLMRFAVWFCFAAIALRIVLWAREKAERSSKRYVSVRGKLRAAITARLVPDILRRGFVGPTSIAGNTIIHEYTRTSRGLVHKLNIQFDKYQRPRFVINLRIQPEEGWTQLRETGGSVPSARIQSRWGISTASWFKADRAWWLRLIGFRSTTEIAAVEKALTRMDAIDRWFDNPDLAHGIITTRGEYILRKNENGES